MTENGNQISIVRDGRPIERSVISAANIGRRDAFVHHLIILLAALVLFLLALLCYPGANI